MIRRARRKDREGLRLLGHSTSDLAALLPGRLWRRRSVTTLVWQDRSGALLGSASGFAVSGFPELWWTGYVRVASAARGRGIGQALVEATTRAAAAAGAQTAFCLIAPTNVASIRLHERVGYQPIEVMRTVLRRESVSHPSNTHGGIEAAILDRTEPCSEIVRRAGIERLVELGNRERNGLGHLGPRVPRNPLRKVASYVRHLPPEWLLLLTESTGTRIGVVVSTATENRIILTDEALKQATPEVFASLVHAVEAVRPNHRPAPALLVFHHCGTAPPTAISAESQRHYVFALPSVSRPDPS